MKSIIIIIAIFLVTLTAKADWVKKNGLEQVQLPDSNFFFTKVNDSCTKMLLVSQKNLKLYIVDLASGEIDREQKIPYNFDICDYDFELESFVFYEYKYIDGNMKSGYKNKDASQNLYKLKKNDSLDIFIGSNISQNNPVIGGEIYLINILNHNLFLSYKRQIIVGYGANTHSEIDLIYKTYYNLEISKVSPGKYSIINSTLYQDGIYIKNGNDGYIGNTNGVFKIQNTKEVNVGSDKFKVLDISGNYLSCKVDDNLIWYVEFNSGKTLNLYTYGTTTVPKMTNYKLINSVAEAVFFKNDNNMNVLDNFTGKVTNTIPFVNGKLYHNKSNNILYSLKDSNLYRTTITPNAKPNSGIIVSQSYFLFGDTIQLTKPDIYFYKDYFWEVNGVKYTGAQPKFQIKIAGNYDVKFSYVDSGITKTILKEKAILVVDSLKVSYSVKNQNIGKDLIVYHPIIFSATSNFPNATYLWEINHCDSYTEPGGGGTRIVKYIKTTKSSSQTFSDLFIYTDGNSARLTVSNGYQKLIYDYSFTLSNNLFISLDKYSGFAPLTVIINASFSCAQCGQSLSSYGGGVSIGDFDKYIDGTFNNQSYTFTKPGIYKIRVSCGYNGTYSYIHDSVLTVYDPTDIQDFAENKYIFKQDADGIYCKLEGEGEVALYDNVGRLVRTYQIQNERYIRKEDLERGFYFLQINLNGEVYHEKVLVE